ncbi:MAG TPA: glycosyltransferase, partial [Pirellulaceae bacterium]
MRCLLAPVGSAGDVYPFLGLGQRLAARGHAVSILTCNYFRDAVERVGLGFAEVSSTESFLRVAGDPRIWHRFHGPRVVCQYTTLLIEPLYRM